MRNKKFILGMFFVIGILLISFGSATYTRSVPSYSQYSNVAGLGAFSGGYSLQVDKSMCGQGQDFLVQISPFGCEPSPVRSDLLEEQDIPVFCQLGATQLNPLVDVEAINYMNFIGDYPREVSGLGFHAAKSALGYQKETLNYPVLDNLGYVVIWLRQQPNESALTNCESTDLGEVCWVEGNLTAQISYDVKNAFGVGDASFYLPVLSDDEWREKYLQYSFWDGRGYLRVEGVSDDEATISIYADESTGKLTSTPGKRIYDKVKFFSTTLKKGEKSQELYLPGFSYCLASFNLILHGLEEPDTRAQLRINNDYVEVKKNEKFLDNKCTIVGEPKKHGLTQEVTINCKEDDEGHNKFSLRIFPRVKLNIDGKTKEYGVGDKLFEAEEKSVYLGYVGGRGDSEKLEDLYVYLVALPTFKTNLDEDEIDSVAMHANSMRASSDSGANFFDSVANTVKQGAGATMQGFKWAVKGENFIFLPYKDIAIVSSNVYGKTVSLEGFADAENNGFMSLVKEEYEIEEQTGILGIKYKIKKNGEDTGLYLGESILGKPKLFISIPSVGTTATAGTFNGENCEKHEDCSKYILSKEDLKPVSGYGGFFENLVSAELNMNEKKISVEKVIFSDFEAEGDYQEYYKKAMSDFETIINSFSQEKEKETSEQTFGEQALYEAIVLAQGVGQKKTMKELCLDYEEEYKKVLGICPDDYSASSSDVSVREVLVNGVIKRISFAGIYEPSFEEYGARVVVEGPNGKIKSFDLRKDEVVPLTGFRNEEDAKKIQGVEYVRLVSLDTDSAQVELSLANQNFLERNFVSDTKTLKEDIKLGSQGYFFTLTDVNLEKSARVSVIPNLDYARTEADFSFKIGIEKRSFPLSPERINDKINALDRNIEDWQKVYDTLGGVVKVMKGACLVTGAGLTVKNLIQNANGKAIARQKVMQGANGWKERCVDLVKKEGNKYKSVDDCFLKKSDDIDKEVNEVYKAMSVQHQNIKKIEASHKEEGGFLGQDYVKTDEFVEDYSKDVRGVLDSLGTEFKPEGKDKAIDITNMKTILSPGGWEERKYSIEQLRDIELYTGLSKSSDAEIRKMAESRLYSVLSDVQVNAGNFAQRATLAGTMEINPDKITYIELDKDTKKYTYEGLTANTKNINLPPGISKDTPIAVVQTKQGSYTFILDDSSGGKNLPIKFNTIPQKDETGKEKKILQYQIYDSKGVLVEGEENKEIIDKFKSSLFQKYDKSTYENEYKAGSGDTVPLLRYYETEPYKGYPAVVPFDSKDGWYAATKPLLGVGGNIAAYDKSARANSFWLCNVGENGIEEFNVGMGDDICEMLNVGENGQPYNQFPGLSETEATTLVRKADDALSIAGRAYKEGVPSVRIFGEPIKVGSPASETPAIQCTDFMSPKDCNLLFNFCDPVICPSSRCDLGGTYPVKDVIQSGIIGSIALCLPNAQEGIKIPVCLSGIHAGIDNWLSVQKSYRDCLQQNLDTGEMIGICDEIHSIYACEFFWRQSLPIIKTAIPKIMSLILGQNVRGGGEYLGVQSAWENAQSSVNYLTQYYAANSYRAFKLRSTEEAGTTICKTFASVVYPGSGNFLDVLTEPDSPSQFTGWFEEIPFTTATNPPLSHYKVFYHIYAGKDSGAYYQVYLSGGSGGSFYQDTTFRRIVGSGYIPLGEYNSSTVDFLAPSGYQQLCIVVNGQEECDFSQVSTSFAINYLNDLYLKEQSSQTDIKTEAECISGTTSLYSLLNPNLEGAVDEMLNPELYSSGIIRICATDDPGKRTDAKAGQQGARWVEVGYCGNTKIKCWQDMKSVKDVIKSTDIENQVIGEVSDNYMALLMGNDYLSVDAFTSKISDIEAEESYVKKIDMVNEIFEKIFWNYQKAQLYLLRGKAYAFLAEALYEKSTGKIGLPCPSFCGEDGNSYYGIDYGNGCEISREGLLREKCEYGCAFGICKTFAWETKGEEEILEEILTLTDARERVLKTAELLEGTSAAKGTVIQDYDNRGGVNCWDSVIHIYNKAGVYTSGISKPCVYSDKTGKEYIVEGTTIKIGVTKNKEGAIIFQNNEKACDFKELNEKQKLEKIGAGDILSIAYDEDSPHNIIFIEWVNPGKNYMAKIFDWRNKDAQGNTVFGYREVDLSDNGGHPVYMFWAPKISTLKTTERVKEQKEKELEQEVFKKSQNCFDCGGSFYDDNPCDEEECKAIGSRILKICVYEETGKVSGGRCLSTITDSSSQTQPPSAKEETDYNDPEYYKNQWKTYDKVELWTFTTVERGVFLYATDCINCGDDEHWYTLGLANTCDERECYVLKLKLGKNCVYGNKKCEEKLDTSLVDYCNYKVYKYEYDYFIQFLEDNNLGVSDVDCNKIFVDKNHIIQIYILSKPLSNLNNLAKLSALKDLRLMNNGLSDVSKLGDLKFLEVLYLSRNNIEDISFVSNLENLESLDLSDNNIKTVPNLLKLNLRYLNLDNNDIADLSWELSLPKDSVSNIWKKLDTLSVKNNCIPKGTNFDVLSKHAENYVYSGNPRSGC